MTDTAEATRPKENHAISNARGWLAEIQTLVLKLNDDGLTDEQRDKVREEIEEGPLSVLVRSDWYSPGDPERAEAAEYEILYRLKPSGCVMGSWRSLLWPTATAKETTLPN